MTGSNVRIKMTLSAGKVMNWKGQEWEEKDQSRVYCSRRAKGEWLSEGVLKLQQATESPGRVRKAEPAGTHPQNV